jgi:hypothetical protein
LKSSLKAANQIIEHLSLVESEPALAGICTQIALELREQYTLGFYPSDLTSKKWHRIKVSVNPPESSPSFSLSSHKAYQRASFKGL